MNALASHVRAALPLRLLALIAAGHCALGALGALGAAQAQEAAPAPAVSTAAAATATATPIDAAAQAAARQRWRAALEAFRAADQAQPPVPGGVLFVGSSSIRLWSRLAQDFPDLPTVLNRGFGGSTLADCELLVSDLVLPYQPRHVLLYAGDNDLAEGRLPLDLLRSFVQFASRVREALPHTRISLISIKPSPSREALMPRIREANHILAAYLRTQANTDFIDIFTPMLDAEGRPRADLFLPDRLHMNRAGYRIWHDAIAAQMTSASPPRPAPPPAGAPH